MLHIGNQSRPDIFDLVIAGPNLLYKTVIECDEEVILPLGDSPSPRSGDPSTHDCQLNGRISTDTLTGEAVCIRREPDIEKLRIDLEKVLSEGIVSLAVVLKHAAIFPAHEKLVGKMAHQIGFKHVSLSHEVMPMIKMVPRGFTAAADAYLTPHIMKYIQTFQSGFDAGLKCIPVYFMQSDGGLAGTDIFSGHKAILSGPAGGYVGYARTTGWKDAPPSSLQMIGFDMGGTSTDVSRYAGELEHVFESTTAGVTIQAPQLDINTVAAGGGSRLFFESGVFRVGPESAGAHPGPVCYRKGGHLAITDANVVLGRILPEYFPKIFGPGEDEPLDATGARQEMSVIADRVPGKDIDEVAMGFIRVANETMCRPIRALTQAKGYDASKHVLSCFGGAGGQHACAIASALGIKTVFVHRFAGILSAVGIALADVVQELQEPCALELNPSNVPLLDTKLDLLSERAVAALKARGFSQESIQVTRFLNLRYHGTDVPIMTARPVDGDCCAAFEAAYKREYGFLLENRAIVVDDARVRASGQSIELPPDSVDDTRRKNSVGRAPLPTPASLTQVYFEQGGRQSTPAYLLKYLDSGQVVNGPAILIDEISTIVIEPSCVATLTEGKNVRIFVPASSGHHQLHSLHTTSAHDVECDPIQLSIFSHRFMGIAEQMGRVLQRTSISVNIKERLDFSCALFDSQGNLVSNAPHLPVHLGAMSEAVKYQIKHYSSRGSCETKEYCVLEEGDVLVSNHPQLAGGSHLPDITVITPVYDQGQIVFFVASRGHHADIGGIAPGSMPPHSRYLREEGAAIVSHKLVHNGRFDEEGISRLLCHPEQGGIGTRNLSDNISDLRAQVAANTRGIALVGELIKEYSLPVVQAYMKYIQSNAENAVREMLIAFSLEQGLPNVGTVTTQDQMDDGTPIALSVTIDRRDGGSAVFDFEGTGPQVWGNTNAPPAVARSAIIYALRCLVTRDIPLNHGCMAPITVKLPAGSLLSPDCEAAVVGGNVLTSQRVTDVVLKAFNAAAASQGCMNNLTFGDENMGYYETIAGGAGAGPGWHGRSGIHTHMTNTRITDPEILERRYPVVLKQFKLRKGSGGGGKWRGGDGVVRELEFLRPLTVSILSERRSIAPFGILGGESAEKGINLWYRRESGSVVSLGGKATIPVKGGDKVIIMTPGGGGCGAGDPKSAPNQYNGGEKMWGSLSAYKKAQESA